MRFRRKMAGFHIRRILFHTFSWEKLIIKNPPGIRALWISMMNCSGNCRYSLNPSEDIRFVEWFFRGRFRASAQRKATLSKFIFRPAVKDKSTPIWSLKQLSIHSGLVPQAMSIWIPFSAMIPPCFHSNIADLCSPWETKDTKPKR